MAKRVQPKGKVLFLCVGNSCRSQMAEAIVNARLGQHWLAQSAGSQPEGYVHPRAIEALREIGIEHIGESKSIDVLKAESFDVVVTLCAAETENCPLWPGGGQKFHLPFPDPFGAVGSEDEIMAIYRRLLADIETQIPALLSEIS